MFLFLREGAERFFRNPLGEAIAAVLFLFAACTGLLLGVGSLLYISYLTTDPTQDPMLARMQRMQALQNPQRTSTAFWLGIIIWFIAILPNFQNLLFGIPVAWLIIQPFWCALLIANRYGLSVLIALRTVWFLTLHAPAVALPLYALGLLAFSGLLVFGIGICATLPIALFATLRVLETSRLEVTAAIQRAY